MDYRIKQLESLCSQAFPNIKAVIELNHIIEGYSIYLIKGIHRIYIELPASDFVSNYLFSPSDNLADLYEESRRILSKFNILKSTLKELTN